MNYLIRPVESLERKLAKLKKNNIVLYLQLMKKIKEIAENPRKYKPMSNMLKGNYRVHIGHFVLLFTIDDQNHLIELKDFDHHDKIYEP